MQLCIQDLIGSGGKKCLKKIAQAVQFVLLLTKAAPGPVRVLDFAGRNASGERPASDVGSLWCPEKVCQKSDKVAYSP